MQLCSHCRSLCAGMQRLIYLGQNEKLANYSALLRFTLQTTKLVQDLCHGISDEEIEIR